MLQFSIPDLIALVFFITAWGAYHSFLKQKETGLNASMDFYRREWMMEMSRRENRVMDASLMASLHQGTAFFASTSLFAVGGVAALLRSAEDTMRIFEDLPLGLVPSRGLFEAKIIGLAAIFGYAFFKFAWAYRLFNYTAILMGATPQPSSSTLEERRAVALRAGHMNVAAGRHFTRGQRAFFFAIAYTGWFVGPYIFMLSTSAILWVMWRRQFISDARAAVTALAPPLKSSEEEA